MKYLSIQLLKKVQIIYSLSVESWDLFLRAVHHLVERDQVELCSIYSVTVYSDTALQYD